MVAPDEQPNQGVAANGERSNAPPREWPILVAVFLAAVAIVVTRRPDAFLNAQFYIEDGQQWFASAHEMGGLRALLEPSYRGYFHTLPRLGALAAVCVPIAWAPLVMSVCAVLVAAATPTFLASSRCAALIPSRAGRIGAALFLAAVPGTWTMMANMTVTPWHFWVLAVLILVAEAPRSRSGWAFDVAATALSGLSGPTPIFLAPVAAMVWGRRRDRWSATLFILTVATAVVQAAGILLTADASEGNAPLAASVWSLSSLLATKIVFVLVAGEAALRAMDGGSQPAAMSLLTVAALLGVGAIIVAALMWRGGLPWVLLVAFAALILAGSLSWPPASLHSPMGYWETLAVSGNGNRYFFIPIVVLAIGLVRLATDKSMAVAAPAIVVLAVVIAVGIRADWREPPLRDYGYRQYVDAYERAKPGEKVQFVQPPGWSFTLTKR